MRSIAAATLLFCSVAALAQAPYEEKFDSEDNAANWEENAVELPAPPSPGDLVPFYVSETATQDFAIDAKSLSVGSDGVVRYTLVTKSSSGATNVSYEGIRCAAYEVKRYAFGQSDGSWSQSRRAEWQRITGNAANRQHAALAKDYFCREKTVAGKPKDMLARLRSGQAFTRPAN